MYHFSYFKEPDQARILAFLEENPFAFLTGSFSSGSPVATQIPVLHEVREGDLYVQGHFMRKTDHHKAFEENPQALVVFTGPHAYVSASWYSNPSIGSTWNYMSVHVRGTMRFMSPEELVALMRKLTLKFEGGDAESPTYYDNLPESFLSQMMPAIVGFELRAESVDNVFKLSQNRDEQSYRNIMEQLEQGGGQAENVAHEMRKRVDELFPPGQEWDSRRFDS